MILSIGSYDGWDGDHALLEELQPPRTLRFTKELLEQIRGGVPNRWKQEAHGSESLRNQDEAAAEEQEAEGSGCGYDGEAAGAGGGAGEGGGEVGWRAGAVEPEILRFA